MGVQVMGVSGREMPGLKAATKAFIKANQENGDALMNIIDGAAGVKGPDGQPLTENDPRPPYQHLSFPKMLYHAKLGERVVEDETELADSLAEGFRDTPFPVVKVAVADPGIEKANLQRELREKDGQITTLASEIQELRNAIREIQGGGERRGPGRPRKEDAA